MTLFNTHLFYSFTQTRAAFFVVLIKVKSQSGNFNVLKFYSGRARVNRDLDEVSGVRPLSDEVGGEINRRHTPSTKNALPDRCLLAPFIVMDSSVTVLLSIGEL